MRLTSGTFCLLAAPCTPAALGHWTLTALLPTNEFLFPNPPPGTHASAPCPPRAEGLPLSRLEDAAAPLSQLFVVRSLCDQILHALTRSRGALSAMSRDPTPTACSPGAPGCAPAAPLPPRTPLRGAPPPGAAPQRERCCRVLKFSLRPEAGLSLISHRTSRRPAQPPPRRRGSAQQRREDRQVVDRQLDLRPRAVVKRERSNESGQTGGEARSHSRGRAARLLFAHPLARSARGAGYLET